jgi:DNA-binding transcriptional ArsR family regulator
MMEEQYCGEELSLEQEAHAVPANLALLATDTAEALAETFSALADPTRVRLIAALAQGELCVGELAVALGMTLSAVSHQLRLLHRLRVVKRRRQGRHIHYALDDDHIATMFRCGLDHLRHG